MLNKSIGGNNNDIVLTVSKVAAEKICMYMRMYVCMYVCTYLHLSSDRIYIPNNTVEISTKITNIIRKSNTVWEEKGARSSSETICRTQKSHSTATVKAKIVTEVPYFYPKWSYHKNIGIDRKRMLVEARLNIIFWRSYPNTMQQPRE